MLTMVKANRGIVMVNFYACFLVDDCDSNNATVKDIVKHINHIRSFTYFLMISLRGHLTSPGKNCGLKMVFFFMKFLGVMV